MKNRIFLILLAMVLVVSLVAFAACAEEEEAPPVVEEEEAPPLEEVWQWPPMLTMSTGSVGSSAHAQTASWTPLMERDTGMKIRLVPESSITLMNQWLKQGLIDIMLQSFAAFATGCLEGKDMDATRLGGPHLVSLIWNQSSRPWGVMVRGDSPIKTLSDIGPGTKIAVFPISGCYLYLRGVLAWIQLPEEQITWVEVASFAAEARAVAEGRADVCYHTPTYGAVIEAAAGPYGVRFVPMDAEADPEGAARFLEFRPTMFFGKAKLGVEAARGVPMPVSADGYIASSRLDPELAYHMAKWLHENFDRYKDLHELNPQMHIDTWRSLLDGMYFPINTGTIKYLKEIGYWTEEDDRRQAYNVDLTQRYVDAYEEAIAMADEKGIRVHPDTEEWIELWENYKKELGLPAFKAVVD